MDEIHSKFHFRCNDQFDTDNNHNYLKHRRCMTYVVNTAWKHTNPIDWKEMQKSLDEVMMNADPNCSVHWFEIDEKFHGSVATFPSKEVYESMRLRRENHRKEANDRGVKMIYEVVGHLKAEAHS